MIVTAVAATPNIPQRASLPDSFRHFESVISSSLRVKRGHNLFHAGDQFSSIYVVGVGSFKTFAGDYAGRQQVTGFALPGDVLGLDGIGSRRQSVSAVALEDSEVVVMPFDSVERAARDDCNLQRELYALMSRQIVREYGVMTMLGSLCASERIAAFLLTLSRRYQRLGYSPVDFHLRMTRADIGCYLGLKIETVSRIFTILGDRGVIEVNAKHIRLLDVTRLNEIMQGRIVLV